MAAGARDRESLGLELSWAEWADGKPWRLKRGKHYRGDPKAVEKDAEAAAREMGKALITSKDSSGKYEYVWVQFVDYAVPRGEPCPHCGGEALTRHSNVLATCDSCDSSLKLVEPKAEHKGSTQRTGGQGAQTLDGQAGSQSDGRGSTQTTNGQDSPARGTEPAKAERHRGRHGEILTTRLLAADGTERQQILVSEEAVLEISYRFHSAGLSVQAGAVFVLGKAIGLQSAQPSPVPIEGSGIYTAALRLPANRLAEGTYAVMVSGMVLDADGTSESLMQLNALSFQATAEPGAGETDQESPAKVAGSGSLVWSVVARPGDVRADGHDSARAGDGHERGIE